MDTISRKAFTLIELLIVIGIIGVLLSIVMFSLATARERSRESAFRTSMSSLGSAASVCCADGGILQSAAAGTLDDGDTLVEICSPVTGAHYPQSEIISVTVTENCDADGGYQIDVDAIVQETGGCGDATISQGNVAYTGC